MLGALHTYNNSHMRTLDLREGIISLCNDADWSWCRAWETAADHKWEYKIGSWSTM